MHPRHFIWLALAAAPASQAACPFVEHTVKGTVVANDAPVAGAVVEATWQERRAGTASTRATTDEVGRYVLTITFDPFSSRSFGGKEKCDARLADVVVSVKAAGRDPYERRVPIRDEPEDVDLALR